MPVGFGIFLFVLTALLFQGWEIVITTFTVLWPGIQSIRAIESEEKDDDKHWLTYWMIYGFLNFFETFVPFVFWFIPYYAWVRLGFFVWLIQFNGATALYNSVVADVLRQNKTLIQDFIKRVGSKANEVTE